MQRICVFTGSSPGARPDYALAAEALAESLVARDIALVYGGASVGVMGRLADAVLARGGKAIGVIPEPLRSKEIDHQGLTELHVVGSMHERKATMTDLADGFVVMPGGLGTLDETFEALTWAQLGLHGKPVGLLNVCGYFDRLLDFLAHAVDQRFIRHEHREMLLVADAPDRLLMIMERYTAPAVKKWIAAAEA